MSEYIPSFGQRLHFEREMTQEIERLRAEIARLRADRRERIATGCLAVLISLPNRDPECIEAAAIATRYADALIAELDKETTP